MNRFRATAVTVLWALAVTASVHASEGGRISFSGAVMVATCSPIRLGPAARSVPQAMHAQCHEAASPAAYTLRVEPAMAHANSRLVTYYADYIRAAGGGDSVWVATQIYD